MKRKSILLTTIVILSFGFLVFNIPAHADSSIIDLFSSPADVKLFRGINSDDTGFQVITGDINGDNIQDAIISTPTYTGIGREIHVAYGRVNWPSVFSLNSGNPDVRIIANNGFCRERPYIATGDITGDEIEDLLIGCQGFLDVIFGGSDLPSTINLLTDFDFRIRQSAVTFLGYSVATGDLNGDGTDDAIVGAPGSSSGDLGAVYAYFGGPGLDTTADLIVIGKAGDRLGSVVASGDITGDGIDDLIAFTGIDFIGGKAHVIYGGLGLPSSINFASTAANLTILGLGTGCCGIGDGRIAPNTLATTGDLNSDGIADLILGAPYRSPLGRTWAGETHVIYGGAGLPATIDLSLDESDLVVYGDHDHDAFGISVAAGDVNGDGIDDLIAGASFADPLDRDGAGKTYVVDGALGLSGVVDLNAASASVTFYGDDPKEPCCTIESAGRLGTSVVAGDVNGDNRDDLIMGAPGADNFSFGDSSGFAVIFLTAGNNTPPIVVAGGPYIVDEGSSVEVVASGNDPEGELLTYDWDLDNNGTFETSGQSVTFSAVGLDGPSVKTIQVQVTDSDGLTATAQTTVNVHNVDPTVGAISLPIDPIQANTAVNASANFTDSGTTDTHTAIWDWGDNSTSVGTINEINGSGSVIGNHSYSTPGVYTVTLTVTDDDNGPDSEIYQYIVIYDPNGGFVTGGGWITSTAGSYTPDPTLTGKATFGFVSKYQKGANVPTGNTEFQFHVAGMNFKSLSYDWLVIAGTKAQYKGTGTINGTGEYKFILTGIDETPDRFRIKVWDKTTSEVIYDNMLGAEDTADPATALLGGSIVIHKAK